MSCSDEMSYGVPARFGFFERAEHRLGERVADDRHLRDAFALHGLPTARAGRSAGSTSVTIAPPRNIAWNERERAGAVHQRRRGQVHAVRARCRRVLLATAPHRRRRVGRQRADQRVARRRRASPTGRRCATSRPSACRWCRRCRGSRGRRRCARCAASGRARASRSSYATANSWCGEPSSTWIQSFTPGARSRTLATWSPSEPWNNSASASELSRR